MSDEIKCPSCGSNEVRTCYFKTELDPVKKKIGVTFNTEFREGWTKTFQCSKCNSIPVKTNIFT